MTIAACGTSATVTGVLEGVALDRDAEPLAGDRSLSAGDVVLRILFLVSAHNGLSQRAWIALTEFGHKVTVAVVGSGEAKTGSISTSSRRRRLPPRSRGATSARSTISCVTSSKRTRTWSSPRSAAMPEPAACRSLSPPTTVRDVPGAEPDTHLMKGHKVFVQA